MRVIDESTPFALPSLFLGHEVDFPIESMLEQPMQLDSIFGLLPDFTLMPPTYNAKSVAENSASARVTQQATAPTKAASQKPDPYQVVAEGKLPGMNVKSLIRKYHVSDRTYRGWKWCVKHNVAIEKRLGARNNKIYTETEQRETVEAAARDGVVETMYRTGIGDDTIRLWAAKFGISVAGASRKLVKEQVLADATTPDATSLARKTGLSVSTIRHWRNQAGLKVHRGDSTRRNLLETIRRREPESMADLFAKSGYSSDTIRKYLHVLVRDNVIVMHKGPNGTRYPRLRNG